MRREIAYIVIFLLSGANVCCQQADSYSFRLIVLDENHAPLAAANVQLLRESKSIKETISDARGMASFQQIPAGNFIFRVSSAGFEPRNTHSYHFPSLNYSDTVQLKTFINSLDEISITGRKSYIQQSRGKTIINVEALPTNVGSTVLEVLEKSPGVTVDQNGNISLKGKSPVLVMIDDKPTYLSPSDLNNLLSSMNSAQVDQIELMPNPPAKYDASGNAGIINIKTKKNNQKGFSGSLTSVAAHGRYPKNSENLNLNYRDGKFNVFLNYNFNYVKYFTDLYALRKYYDTSGKLTSILDQPANFTGNYFNNTIKAGLDYSFSARTVLGLAVGATAIHRSGTNYGNATWLEPSGATDSTIDTKNDNVNSFKNATINVNARHSFSDKQDISADFDALYYRINTAEDFTNQFLAPGGYVEESRGSIPTTIRITSGKVDYSLKVASNTNLQAGVKSSYSATDNLASYQNLVSGAWVEDNTMNNHFLYHENVNAIYGSMDGKYGKADIQAGLRYETTDYHGDQQGNAIQKDSAFSRHYGGLFPSGSISYQADSANNFTLTAGRRIDRPVYQTLNPFYFIIN
ncbi:MAG TPA: outer membrane beta-barrel protein, partial [Puia sp.]|nr:outer membrane beta-barrel protein [Puia sp.]